MKTSMEISRTLRLRESRGVREIAVLLSAPVEHKDGWTCRYEVHWPEGIRGKTVSGADGVQALCLAMEMVAIEIYSSPHHKSGRLYWQEVGAGYGFPMPKVGRDALVGNDRELQV